MIHVYPPTPLPYFPFDSKLISYPDFEIHIILFLEFVKKGYLNIQIYYLGIFRYRMPFQFRYIMILQ